MASEHDRECCQKGLTCIPQGIHCAATREGEPLSEVDIIAIDLFLDTLAEVALAVASRRFQKEVEQP